MSIFGCVIQIFLIATFATAFIAIRSIWKLRRHPPFTPLRLGVALTVTVGGLLTAGMTTDEPSVLLIILVLVLVSSAIWLAVYGPNPSQ